MAIKFWRLLLGLGKVASLDPRNKVWVHGAASCHLSFPLSFLYQHPTGNRAREKFFREERQPSQALFLLNAF